MLAVPALPVGALILLTLAGAIALFWRGRGIWFAALPLTAAIILLLQYQPPDILVANDAKLMGNPRLRLVNYILSSRQSDRYAAADWLRRNGQAAEEIERWPTEGAALHGQLNCAEGGCHFMHEGYKVAF